MPGTIFGLPFDEELFMDMWAAAPDPTLTAMINSGAVVEDGNIAEEISGKGNFYTIPFYNTLSGEDQNYDGQTDIEPVEVDGGSQSGIVYGRTKAFYARNFTAELSGGDPMGHIVATVANYWQKKRQEKLIGIADAIFGITGAASTNAKKWHDNHTLDTTASASGILETDFIDLATQACGDNKGAFGLAIMHSKKAAELEKRGLLEYWKYTDAQGIQRPTNIASVAGYTVIIDDGVPVTVAEGIAKYTTYLFGNGVIRTAKGRVDVPVESVREALKNGGQDVLVTRMRETLHPNGFSFKIPTSAWTGSPTNAQLSTTANWTIAHDQKAIPIARLITK